MFETFSLWLNDFAAIIGACVIVASVVYTGLRIATRKTQKPK